VNPPKLLHDPDNVIETIVRLAQNPTDQEIVGADGVIKIFLKNVVPKVAEKLGAKQIHRMPLWWQFLPLKGFTPKISDKRDW
jgi:hypothetical protein